MSNPASELLIIINKWQQGGEGPMQEVREMNTVEQDNSTRDHVNAMAYIHEIHRILDRYEADGRTVSSYRKAAGVWARTVLSFPHGWSAPNGIGSNIWPYAQINMLEAMADMLDITELRVAPGAFDEISDYLAGILRLLGEDGSISDQLRAHILKLVQEIRMAVDEHRVTGHFSSEESLTRLWVALTAAADQSKGSKGKWRDTAAKIIVPASSSILGGAAMLSLTTAAKIAGIVP